VRYKNLDFHKRRSGENLHNLNSTKLFNQHYQPINLLTCHYDTDHQKEEEEHEEWNPRCPHPLQIKPNQNQNQPKKKSNQNN